MKKTIYFLFFLAILFHGCDEIVKTKTSNPTAVSGDVNMSDAAGNIIDFKKPLEIFDDNVTTTPTENNITSIDSNETNDTTELVEDENSVDSNVSIQKCTTITNQELMGSNNTLSNSLKLSQNLLLNAQDMLKLSQSLKDANPARYINPTIYAQTEYIVAMLQLSQDILNMANKIGVMSDRILVMGSDIGVMSERIIKTQKLQNKNIALTQKNILEAQQNFQKFFTLE